MVTKPNSSLQVWTTISMGTIFCSCCSFGSLASDRYSNYWGWPIKALCFNKTTRGGWKRLGRAPVSAFPGAKCWACLRRWIRNIESRDKLLHIIVVTREILCKVQKKLNTCLSHSLGLDLTHQYSNMSCIFPCCILISISTDSVWSMVDFKPFHALR